MSTTKTNVVYSFLSRNILLVFLVIMPNILNISYWICHPNRYTSSTRILVYRKDSGNSFSGVMQGNSGGADSGAGRVFAALIDSENTWRKVNKETPLSKIYQRGPIYGYCSLSDAWACGPIGLLDAYRRRLSTHIDVKSGVLYVHSTAYTATDSLTVLQRALKISEQRLFQLHEKEKKIELRQAETVVQNLTKDLANAQARINSYLYQQKSLLPSTEDVATLRLLTTLESDAAHIAGQRQALAAGAAHNPMIKNLDAEYSALEQRIATTRQKVPQLTMVLGKYTAMQLQVVSLEERLKLANGAYVKMLVNSKRPWYSLHVISVAQKPLGPSGPDRKSWIFWVLIGTLLLWSIVR